MELRRLREAADPTIQQAAERLAISTAKLSRIENAHVIASQADVLQMLQLYGADQKLRDTLIQIAREARQKGWWRAYDRDVPVPVLWTWKPKRPPSGCTQGCSFLACYRSRTTPGRSFVPFLLT